MCGPHFLSSLLSLWVQAEQAQITIAEHSGDSEAVGKAVAVEENVISALYDEQRRNVASGNAARSQELSDTTADAMIQQAEDDLVSV